MEPVQNRSSSRLLILIGLLVAVAVLTPFMSYLGVVFGWTNPEQAPPGGSGLITRSGNYIGVNTVNPSTTLTVSGDFSIAGNTGKDFATPVAGTDAVNKDYVDQAVAAAGGAGAASVTTYGVSAWRQPAGFWRPGGALPSNCFRSINIGSLQCASGPAAPGGIAAGDSAPACPAGWTELYPGYGPFGNIILWNGNLGGEQEEDTDPNLAVAATYSVCATSAYLNIPVTQTVMGQLQAQSSLLGACVGVDPNNPGSAMCNTCRVCVIDGQ